MSSNFSVNQYDDAFKPKRIRNWQTHKSFQEMPRTRNGGTRIISNDLGHLKPEYHRPKTNPWGNFVGTWDLPKHLPGNQVNVPTSRSREANEKLRRDWEMVRNDVTGQRWGTSHNNALYEKGTRSYAPSTKLRSKHHGKTVEFALEDASSSPGRKLSPIDRSATCLQYHVRVEEDGGPAAFDASYCINNEDRVPLPQLSKSILVEADDARA